MKVFTKAVASGIMIAIGVTVFLACDNKVVGAALFSIALFTICSFGMNLFTGKIGYVLKNKNAADCAVIWLGNFAGCAAASLLVRIAKPQYAEKAASLMDAKIGQSWLAIAILSFFCGILMYVAVENFASNPSGCGKVVGIFLCIMTFILCGFEHSIADMGYAVFGITNPVQAAKYLLFLLVVSAANGLGAIMMCSLQEYNRK